MPDIELNRRSFIGAVTLSFMSVTNLSEQKAQAETREVANILASADLPKAPIVETDPIAERGFAAHEKFGCPLPDTEVRRKVQEFYNFRSELKEKYSKMYFQAAREERNGNPNAVKEFLELEKKQLETLTERDLQLKFVPDCDGFSRVCDWHSHDFCYEYAFKGMLRHRYAASHTDRCFADLERMGYEIVPPEKPQDFDVVMYYTLDNNGHNVEPLHWGVVRNGKVISKNLADKYVYQHNLEAQPSDYYMLFRKTDPSQQDPRNLPLHPDYKDYVEYKAAMVPYSYLHPVRAFILDNILTAFVPFSVAAAGMYVYSKVKGNSVAPQQEGEENMTKDSSQS